jgi:hypothetical protein
MATAPVSTLTREAEYAYIRADLRRLMVISGILLALMLVIMIAINR